MCYQEYFVLVEWLQSACSSTSTSLMAAIRSFVFNPLLIRGVRNLDFLTLCIVYVKYCLTLFGSWQVGRWFFRFGKNFSNSSSCGTCGYYVNGIVKETMALTLFVSKALWQMFFWFGENLLETLELWHMWILFHYS